MKIYEHTYSMNRPQEIETTSTKVFVASNIEEITLEVEEKIVNCFSYTLTEYDKDEYLDILFKQQTDITALQEELQAAKILLGVE
jgi:hypothetical protein